MDTIANLFNAAAEQFPETLGFLFNHSVKALVLLSFGGGGVLGYGIRSYRGKRRARKSIQNRKLSGTETTVSYTTYTDSGILNAETGKNFIDQRIRTFDDNSSLEKMFNSELSPELLNLFAKAIDECDGSNITVFNQLKDLVARGAEKNTFDQIRKGFVNFWSKRLNSDADMLENMSLPLDLKMEENIFYPVLVSESYASIEELHVLVIPKRMLEDGYLPDSKNLRVEVRKEVFEHQPNHPHAKRLDSNKIIVKDLLQDESFLRKMTEVAVLNGKVKSALTLTP